MHELSLAQSIVEAVADSARANGISKVRKVTILVGEWSAVIPGSLEIGFQMLSAAEGELLTGAELNVRIEPAEGECTACGRRFPAGETGLSCPACGSVGRLLTGTALQILSYEGE